MQRTGFRQQSIEEVKAKQDAKIAPTRLKLASKPIKAKKASKSKKKGYQVPKWFKSIKLGSHGSSPAQKKLWTVVREKYLQEDFIQFQGKCVTCNTRFERWQDSQLAHYRAWSVCNSFFKYERKNLRMSCSNCNRLSDGVIGKRFADALVAQYGEDHLDWIETENLKYCGQKLEEYILVGMAEKINPLLITNL